MRLGSCTVDNTPHGDIITLHLRGYSLNLVKRSPLKMQPSDEASKTLATEVIEDEVEQHRKPVVSAAAEKPLIAPVGDESEQLVGERVGRQHIRRKETRVRWRRLREREERQER